MTTAWKKDMTLQGQEALLVGSNLKASGGQGCSPWLWVWSNEKKNKTPKPPHLLVLILDLSQNIIAELMEQILLLNNKGH